MTVSWNGTAVEVPCVTTRSFLDSRSVPRTPNCYTNNRHAPGQYNPALVQPITGAVWHTVHGTAKGAIAEPSLCLGESSALAYVQDFARTSREASTAFVIARTGTAFSLLDLVTDRGWGSGAWNPFTVQCELDQSVPGDVCLATINAAVDLAWWFCNTFAIQPMLPVNHNGEPFLGDSVRLKGEGARTFRGHFFHANQDVRGQGDPGPELGNFLLGSGFEGYEIESGQDKVAWKERQAFLEMPLEERDGIPGPKTIAALQSTLGRVTWATRRLPPSCDTGGNTGAGIFGAVVVAGIAYGGVQLWKRRKKRRAK